MPGKPGLAGIVANPVNMTRNPSSRFRSFVSGPGLPVILVLALLVVLQALPTAWRDALAYQRTAVEQGEIWRLLTANVVHLGWGHLLLNAAGLVLILWIFGESRSGRDWLTGFVISGLAASTGVYLSRPDLLTVVGLSGALHGLFVLGAIGWIRDGDRMGWALLAVLAAKLAWEHFVGAVPMSAEIVGGAVVTEAHLWGAAGGALAGLWETWRWYRQNAPL